MANLITVLPHKNGYLKLFQPLCHHVRFITRRFVIHEVAAAVTDNPTGFFCFSSVSPADDHGFIAEVLNKLGARHVMVVHSNDGLDEISIGDETQVAELRDGKVSRYTISPDQFGISRSSLDTIKASDPE